MTFVGWRERIDDTGRVWTYCRAIDGVTATLDTNTLDDEPCELIRDHAETLGLEVAIVGVTRREGRDEVMIGDQVVPEVMVWGESRWNEGVWSSEELATLFEEALRIVSNGSFPPSDQREELNHGERNQLRDAMIFQAHVKARRDMFVTNDRKGFVKDGRREKLEELGCTTIWTPAEFLTLTQSSAAVGPSAAAVPWASTLVAEQRDVLTRLGRVHDGQLLVLVRCKVCGQVIGWVEDELVHLPDWFGDALDGDLSNPKWRTPLDIGAAVFCARVDRSQVQILGGDADLEKRLSREPWRNPATQLFPVGSRLPRMAAAAEYAVGFLETPCAEALPHLLTLEAARPGGNTGGAPRGAQHRAAHAREADEAVPLPR